MKQVEEVIMKYKAEDGAIFNSERECLLHERRMNLQTIYLVVNKGMHLKAALTRLEIFSTIELAKDSLKNVEDKGSWKIIEKYIDEVLR